MENIETVNKAIELVKMERRRIIKELDDINGVKAFDSQTNFVLFQTKKESKEVFQDCLNQGVLVRDFGNVPRLDRCLRATVGLPEMNDKLLTALKQIFGG
jgi:histidinol-phosphate aminotransferase